MARIPLQTANRSLDTGSVVQYPSGSPIGSALEGAGNQLQAVAQRFQQKQDQKDGFDARLRETEFTASLAGLEDQTIQTAPEDAGGIHDAVVGQIDPSGAVVKPGNFDTLFDQYKARVPASQQTDFEAKRESYRLQSSNRMAGAQYAGEQAYYKVQIEKTQTQIVNSILAGDPNDMATYEQFKSRGAEIIDKSGMPALAKDVAKTNWEANASETLFKLKLEKDPAFAENARAALGLAPIEPPAPGVSGNAAVNTVVDKIIGVESGGNPNAKNPTSSASGLGQFINSTWLATVKKYRPDIAAGKSANEILALKNDPSLGREMTTRYTEENAQFLTNRGIATTPGNLYLAHFLGPQGATNALKADPGASVASVLGQDVVRANGFLAGKSIADLKAWSDKKMGGKGVPADPAFTAIPPDRRLVLANQADGKVSENRALLRGGIETTVQNAPIAIQNTGEYSGTLPGREEFQAAYGPQDGNDRYAAFQALIETSQQANSMRTMSGTDINAMVEAAKPLSSGDTAALDQKRYDALAGARDAVMKAREADPSTYTQQVFPTIAKAWQDVQQQPPASRDYQSVLAMTAAAQRQLGITNMQLLPNSVAASSVTTFKDEARSEQDRIGAVAGLVFSTSNPEQRLAVFDQLVKAGLPEITAGAIRASARGDIGAAQRLFQAAMIDVSKLPGQNPDTAKPAAIDAAIQTQLMDVNQIGDVYYGLSDGSAENMVAAQRDSKLMTNAVTLRVRKGESLDGAVTAVAKDLFGDVKPVSGANVSILIPSDQDENVVTTGLDAMQPQVRKTLEQTLTIPGEVKGVDSALMNATRANEINRLMLDGYWRNAGNGFAFLDPKTGLAVAGPDGNPLIFSEKEVLAAGGTAKANAGSVGQTLISPTNNYDARTPEPGAGPSLDENGNPVVLGQ